MRKSLKGLVGTLFLASGVVLAQQPAVPVQPTPQQIQQLQQMRQMMMAKQMQMMSLMFDVRASKLGFDETLAAIVDGAGKRGWKVGETQDMQALMRQNGAQDARPMKVVSLCPAGANEKVSKAGAGKTPPLPCRATVFLGKDGKIYVMRTNYDNMAKAIGGEVGKALTEVGAEEAALYKDILQ